jgi:TetR/AcrR family transcriptional regulator
VSTAPVPPQPRAERTRAAILEAAERLFAERGFDATRLEDVAREVGIRRASIVYHFRDKADLHHAVLASVFGDLLERVRASLEVEGPAARRIEAAVSAWVDTVGRRPSLARLLLREVAGAAPERGPALLEHLPPFREAIDRFLADPEVSRALADAPVDAAHLASTIAGSTVFFVAAIPRLVPDLGFDPLSPRHLEAHKAEVLRITRRLLGLRGPRRAGRAAARRR